MSTPGCVRYSEGYHEYSRGIPSVQQGDTMMSVGDIMKVNLIKTNSVSYLEYVNF